MNKDKEQIEIIESDIKKEMIWWGRAVAVAFGTALFLNSSVIVNAVVPTGSMENTISSGDRFFGSRLAYLEHDPKRLDIIVFKYPDDESQLYIKRIIGLPGEKIEIVDGKVYINDSTEPLKEKYLPEEMRGSFGPYNVPGDSYFVMGDNRNHSNDSRKWNNKYVHRNQIIGKALFRYWPTNHMGKL